MMKMKIEILSFIVAVIGLVVLIVSQMYPNYFPTMGKVLVTELSIPIFWLALLGMMVVIQFIYIVTLKGWI